MGRRGGAQDPRYVQGKILRVNRDGSVPEDNPYPGSPAYAVGFRNVWGLAFHPRTGRLYATDNGPRGYDEVNLVLPGLNYGYPTIEGGRGDRPGLVDPLWDSGEERLGIAGGAFYTGDRFPEYRGDFFFCAFNSGTLRRARLGGAAFDVVEAVETVADECRLDVADGPDGTLYFTDMFQIRRLVR